MTGVFLREAIRGGRRELKARATPFWFQTVLNPRNQNAKKNP
jgi:hypothetical protein